MKAVLLLDTETTGVTPRDTVIEVAGAVFDVRHAAVVRSFSYLMLGDRNPAERVNNIPASLLASGSKADGVWAAVGRQVATCGAIVSHNAAFDRRYVPAEVVGGVPWVCSSRDIAWPRQKKSGESLASLALAHGIGVASAHRAYADVDILARLLSRVAETADIGALLDDAVRKAAARHPDPAL